MRSPELAPYSLNSNKIPRALKDLICIHLSTCQASSSQTALASFSILSISLDKRPLSFVMVDTLGFARTFSRAETLRIPLASMSKVTPNLGFQSGTEIYPHTFKLPCNLGIEVDAFLISAIISTSVSSCWRVCAALLSQAVLSLRRDLVLDLRSLRCLRLNSSRKSVSPSLLSKSSSQMSVPAVDLTSQKGSFINNSQDRNIKSSTTQIKDENILFSPIEILVKSI
ncbi:hypothetical protein TNIN_369101 [Trichonephila inaurata madagascariensis]|uniref:Uncharacterized protein n=1 Tax=Trichonephila inaurata madagascariensis TaxID=2747483 RepID=A0A8X6XY50_9ARAC|nr:hypothetical protein TNIN_369101 [Trichonephila inaurata madagascariensis]